MDGLTDREKEYLNLPDDFNYGEHLPEKVDQSLPSDYHVYIVAKWCRRVGWDDKFNLTPKSYCDFACELDKYEYPVFEKS